MIAFARGFFRRRGKRPLRLPSPLETVVITGAREERIDAHIGAHNRVVRLIVYTRQRAIGRDRSGLTVSRA